MAGEAHDIELINTLICSIEGAQVMLPDIAIAEIVEFQPTAAASDDVPTWYLGKLVWRGLDVPVISLEAMDHDAFFTQGSMLKIIIINATENRERLPYWGFVSQETPRMMRINRESIAGDPNAMLGHVEAIRAEVYGDPVMLPDLTKIEQQILALLG